MTFHSSLRIGALSAFFATACGAAPSAPPAPMTTSAARAASELEAISPDFPRVFATTRGFTLGDPARFFPTDDGRTVLFLRAGAESAVQSLWETDVATGNTRELLRPDALVRGAESLSPEEKARRERQRIRTSGFTSFESSPDGREIIVSLSGRLYRFTRASGRVRELPTGAGAAIDPHLSPDATRVAYVRGNDVYMVPLEGGKEMPITHGGTEDRPNGSADFIAQEEFRRSRGFWWSPDGQKILYEVADVSHVQRWALADPEHPEKPPEIRPYPRAGTTNAIVGLAITSVAGDSATPRAMKWDFARYPYLASVTWSKNAPPTIEVLDREQHHAALLALDVESGAARPLLTEENAAWIDVDPSVPRWLPDGSAFLWSTERRGAWELELHDARGERTSTLAPAAAGYRRLLGIDSEKHIAYVSTAADSIRAEVWALPFDGSPPRPIARLADGIVSAFFGESSRTYAYIEGNIRGERRFGIRTIDGGASKEIAIPSLAKTPPFQARIEYTTVGPDAFHAALVRPHDFDPKRRYPIIDFVYAGPGTNIVFADARNYLEGQWMADVTQSVVVYIDGYACGRRTPDWSRKAYGHVGDLPLEGQVVGVRELAKKYPELDAERVGIYGWSNGGYMSALAILRRPDVFKAAVAGAPVSDWTDYDTALSERFLGVPPNPGYEAASLLTWASHPPSASSPARPFLLIHGTVDDNVYFANSVKLAAAMERAGRPVEFMPIEGATHMAESMPDTGPSIWLRRAAFLRDHLRTP